MKKMIGFSKKVISFCMILCIILSLGNNINELESLKVEKQGFLHEVGNFVGWEQSIVPVIRSIDFMMMKQVVRTYETEAFWVVLQNVQVRLGYLLYMKFMIIGLFISVFCRIIIYIHNKDGPKQVISPI